MEIKSGNDRVAFVGDRYTFKVAKANPIQCARYARKVQSRQGTAKLVELWKSGRVEYHQSLKNFLFRGLASNVRERRLAQSSNIVTPTFSVLGIVNVQRTAEPISLSFDEVYKTFYESVGIDVTKIGHSLENTSNLGLIDGEVKFVDGGSYQLEALCVSRSRGVREALASLSTKNSGVRE